MKILRKVKNTQTGEGKHVGVILPRQLASYLGLYSLAKGISKSMLVRGQMQRWFSEEQRTNPDGRLIKSMVSEIQHEFDRRKMDYSPPTFEEFKMEVKKELKAKGIDSGYIASILTMLGP